MRYGLRYGKSWPQPVGPGCISNDRLWNSHAARIRPRLEGRRGPGPRPPTRCPDRGRGRAAADLLRSRLGQADDRPNLAACLKALRRGDVLVVWKLDRLGRDLRHLVNTVQALSDRGIGLKVLAGQGAEVDTTTAGGKFVFGIFAALAEFERELIRRATRAGLEAARARGRKGGRKFSLTKRRSGSPRRRWASRKRRSASCARSWASAA